MRGVVVRSVKSSSPAAAAGVVPGLVAVSVDGTPVETEHDLLSRFKARATIRFEPKRSPPPGRKQILVQDTRGQMVPYTPIGVTVAPEVSGR